MKRRLCLMFLLALLSAFAGAPAEGEGAELTLMIYMCGSNLESQYASAGSDLEEIAASGVDAERVNVLIMSGGARHWSTGQSTGEIEINRLRHNKRRNENQMVREVSMPARSMGEAGLLREFLEYARENHPADSYALILWDHGGGPMEGVCMDELYAPDKLTLDELAEALRESPFAGKGLSWIGFDACLMGSTEVALQVAPYARYMICSEETEPAMGWNYSFLDDIASDLDGAATGRRIVDAYLGSHAEGPMTLSCIDLNGMEPLRQQIDALFALWSKDVDEKTYSRIAKQRKAILGYGMDVGRSMRDHDLIDLGHLVATFTEADAAQGRTLMDAVGEAVVYQSSNLGDSCGLTVYFPFYNKERYEKVWRDAYARVSAGEGYRQFIERFGGILTGAPLADWRGLHLAVFEARQRETLTEIFSYESMMDRVDARRIDDSAIITPMDQDAAGDGMLAKVLLDPEQQAAFGSARLLVMERLHTALSSQTRYRVVYTSPELGLDDDGAVRAYYHEQTLHIVDKNGDSLASDISYNTLDNGEIAVHMLARSSYESPEDEDVRMIMTFRMDADENLERTGLFIYDPLTDTYERRTGYDVERYPYVVFPYRYMTLSREGGDAEDAVAWTDSEDYSRENIIRFTDDWRAVFKTTSGMPALTLCMEITDTQNERHLTELRTLNSGEHSRDMLYNIGLVRVLMESMQVRESRVSLKLTFIASEDADQDIYLFDPAIDGRRCDFLGYEGECPCGFEQVHISAGSTSTRTFSLDAGGLDAVSEVSLRFAIDYDDATATAGHMLDSDVMTVPLYGSVLHEREWRQSNRAKLRLTEPLPLNGPMVLLPGGDVQLLGASMDQSEDPFTGRSSISPLDGRLDGELRVSRVRAQVPPEAAGYASACLVGGMPDGDMLRVTRMADMEAGDRDMAVFCVPASRATLMAGGEALPLLIHVHCGPNGEAVAALDQDIIALQAGEDTHRLDQILLGRDGIQSLRWRDQEPPVELSETAATDEICVRLAANQPFLPVHTATRTATVDRLPLRVRCEKADDERLYAVFLDENGLILAFQEVTDGGEDVALESVTSTRVERVLPGRTSTEQQVWQGDWTGRVNESGGVTLTGYSGQEARVEVPETLGGLPVSEIAEDAFNGRTVTDLALPGTLRHMDTNCFREASGQVQPFRGTMTVNGPMSAFTFDTYNVWAAQQPGDPDPEDLAIAVEQWGFERIIFDDTELIWRPPLIYRRTASGDLTVAGCDGGHGEARIPAEVEGHRVVAVGRSAFQRSAYGFVRSLVIDEGVERIGEKAFSRSSLTSVTLPKSLKDVATDAFRDCGMLRYVEIGCDPEALPDGLFSSCPMLKSEPGGITFTNPEDEARRGEILERLGIEAPSGGASASAEDFLGYWEYEREYVTSSGMVSNALLFKIAIYENGTYNGVYLNPIAGQWTLCGDALLTEHFALFREGDALVIYANGRRMVCHRDIEEGDVMLPLWNVHVTQ